MVKDADCKNCGMCIASCSGQAIFLVNEECEDGMASITMPYEFLPYPVKGTKGSGLDRAGRIVCEAVVDSVKTSPAFDKTALLTIKVPKEYANTVRFFK